MDAILQFLIDWGYWGLFLGSFIRLPVFLKGKIFLLSIRNT